MIGEGIIRNCIYFVIVAFIVYFISPIFITFLYTFFINTLLILFCTLFLMKLLNRWLSEERIQPIKKDTVSGFPALSENLKDVFLSEGDSDVILKVGDQTFPAHKVIIRARSRVFYSMLKHDMTEKNKAVMDIADCNPDIFRTFLYFLYTGVLDSISKENIFQLYNMSHKYDVKDLSSKCVCFIHKNLSVDIIYDVILLASRHGENDLLTQAINFFADNVDDVLEKVKWQKFVEQYPKEASEVFLKIIRKISSQQSSAVPKIPGCSTKV